MYFVVGYVDASVHLCQLEINCNVKTMNIWNIGIVFVLNEKMSDFFHATDAIPCENMTV